MVEEWHGVDSLVRIVVGMVIGIAVVDCPVGQQSVVRACGPSSLWRRLAENAIRKEV
jgi:hypothetical protein